MNFWLGSSMEFDLDPFGKSQGHGFDFLEPEFDLFHSSQRHAKAHRIQEGERFG